MKKKAFRAAFPYTLPICVGFLFLGTDVGIKTVYSSMLMSFSLSALDRFMPMAGTITDQPMLELIFAIFLPAVGSAVLFNIGASGQFIIGGFAAVYVGIKCGSLGPIQWVVALVAAIIAGMIWGAVPGIFKAFFNVFFRVIRCNDN